MTLEEKVTKIIELNEKKKKLEVELANLLGMRADGPRRGRPPKPEKADEPQQEGTPG